jgi:hypothetical protein
MRLTKSAAVVGASLMIAGMGATASAAGSLSKTVIAPAGETITVNWSGITIPAGLSNVVYVQQCVKNDSGPFNQLTDCSQATGLNPDVGAGGAGSVEFAIFGGDDPNLGEWGCGPNTTPGIPKGTNAGVDTCWVRIAPGNATNTATDEFFPFTFGSGPDPVIPEVPLNVLLPGSAAAILGASLYFARRRQQVQA